MPESVQFSLDPRCPWCWQTSKWVRRLEQLDIVAVRWGTFCLELQNFPKPLDRFDETRCVSAPALRTLVAVREVEGDVAAGRFYEAVGTRYFDLEGGLGEGTVRAALHDAGLDEEWCAKAMGDRATWTTVLEEHHSLVSDTRSFGVPTIRLDGGSGPAIFGPVVSNAPSSDDEAAQLWQHVSWLVRYDNFSELKRDRTVEPDLAYWRTFLAARAAERAAAELAS
jgi:protein-disulfide isomerase-like protein with CxxC motif